MKGSEGFSPLLSEDFHPVSVSKCYYHSLYLTYIGDLGMVSCDVKKYKMGVDYMVVLCKNCYPYPDPHCEICEGRGEYELMITQRAIPA